MYGPEDIHLTSVQVWPNIGHTSGDTGIADYVVIFVALKTWPQNLSLDSVPSIYIFPSPNTHMHTRTHQVSVSVVTHTNS